MYKFLCPYHQSGCSRRFRSQSGRTYHVRSAHGDNHNIFHNQSENEPEDSDNNNDFFAAAEHRDDDVPPSAPGSPIPPPIPPLFRKLFRNEISIPTLMVNFY